MMIFTEIVLILYWFQVVIACEQKKNCLDNTTVDGIETRVFKR